MYRIVEVVVVVVVVVVIAATESTCSSLTAVEDEPYQPHIYQSRVKLEPFSSSGGHVVGRCIPHDSFCEKNSVKK